MNERLANLGLVIPKLTLCDGDILADAVAFSRVFIAQMLQRVHHRTRTGIAA